MVTLKEKVAIVGIGESKYSQSSGVSTLNLAVQCSLNAILDAGLTPKDIDGIMLFWLQEPLSALNVAEELGISRGSYHVEIQGGGNNGTGMVTTAAAAINSGLADTILCLHAINRSSTRASRGGPQGPRRTDNFGAPFGRVAAPQLFAMAAQRHMHNYGTQRKHFGEIAVAERYHASLNEKAIMRDRPLTMEDYFNARMISTPFGLFDCCLETDNGTACILTSAQKAQDMKQRPIYIMAGASNSWGPVTTSGTTKEEECSFASRYVAQRIYPMAGITPKDVDFAELYDCFTYTVLCQLEDYGFCQKGEGGPFVEGGRIRLGGELPVNTHGGHLSETYARSMNHINEAVRQLRGVCGQRQVKNAEIGLVTSCVPNASSAIILRR